MIKKIPFSKNDISEITIKSVEEVLKSGWLTHGKYTSKFENNFKKYTKSKYAVTVSSCTAGLHLSCLASGFSKGDEVIVPAQTHTATAHAVEYTGAKAIFADIDLYSGLISIKDIKKKITKRTKGIIVVHHSGYVANINKIKKICNKYKLKLIEDCAHALGSHFKKKHVGNFGKSGVFSFYPTKQITTGEGGMLICNDRNFYLKVKKLKAFGIDSDIKDRKKPGLYDVKSLGFNYRMTDFQAAIGYHALKKYPQELMKRKENAKLYTKLLSDCNFLNINKYFSNSSYFIFQIFLKKNMKLKLMDVLKKNNIGFSVHYQTSLDKMTFYKNKYKINNLCKNSILYGEQNISLPVHSGITKEMILKISQLILNLKKN